MLKDNLKIKIQGFEVLEDLGLKADDRMKTNILNSLNHVALALESLGITGSIKLDISNDSINTYVVDNTYYGRWKNYVNESNFVKEESYVSEWSPNNGSEIGKIQTRNVILQEIITSFYNYYHKYESVNMINILCDFISDLDYNVEHVFSLKKKYKDDVNLKHFMSNMSFEDKLKEFEQLEHSELKADIQEVLDIFFSRNPKFKFDW